VGAKISMEGFPDLVPVVPGHWRLAEAIRWPPGSGNIAGHLFEHKLTELRVIRSFSTIKGGEKWVHISVSRPDRLPSWEELTKVKNEFLGEDVEAYQVLPRKEDYVNTHRYCLHLWMPADKKRRVANLQDLIMERALGCSRDKRGS